MTQEAPAKIDPDVKWFVIRSPDNQGNIVGKYYTNAPVTVPEEVGEFVVVELSDQQSLENNCDELDELYPHALRATAASYHAGRGLGVTPLQSMMGWADLQTPMRYVKSSGKNTARELENIHNR